MVLKKIFKSGLGILLVHFLLTLIFIMIESFSINKYIVGVLFLIAPFLWIVTLVLGIKNYNSNKIFSGISISISIMLLLLFIILNLFALCKGLGFNLFNDYSFL